MPLAFAYHPQLAPTAAAFVQSAPSEWVPPCSHAPSSRVRAQQTCPQLAQPSQRLPPRSPSNAPLVACLHIPPCSPSPAHGTHHPLMIRYCYSVRTSNSSSLPHAPRFASMRAQWRRQLRSPIPSFGCPVFISITLLLLFSSFFFFRYSEPRVVCGAFLQGFLWKTCAHRRMSASSKCTSVLWTSPPRVRPPLANQPASFLFPAYLICSSPVPSPPHVCVF